MVRWAGLVRVGVGRGGREARERCVWVLMAESIGMRLKGVICSVVPAATQLGCE